MDKVILKLAIVVGTILVIIISLPFWFLQIDWVCRNFTLTGPIGDSFGGIMGPGIAIIGAILTFLAFYIQYEANLQQRNQFKLSLRVQSAQFNKSFKSQQDQFTNTLDLQKDQFEKTLNSQIEERKETKKSWQVERFENRFFELVRLHKDNVNEMNIAGRLQGKRCFVPMFYELRHIYIILERLYDQNAVGANSIKLLNLAYTIFFYGTGYNSEKHFLHKLSPEEKELYNISGLYITELQDAWRNRKRSLNTKEFKTSSKDYDNEDILLNVHVPLTGKFDNLSINLYYKPFDGHVNLLGHYYRHLFQTAKYVIKQDFLEHNEKYDYLKILRAQLSNFEQLMLYYNSSAWFPNEWKELFTEFKFIKNIPLDLADFDMSPRIRFATFMESLYASKGETLFEQQ